MSLQNRRLINAAYNLAKQDFPEVKEEAVEQTKEDIKERLVPTTSRELAGSYLRVNDEGHAYWGDIGDIRAATPELRGTVFMAANVSEAAGDTPTAEEFNALLAALKAAGIMEADSTGDNPDPEPDPEPAPGDPEPDPAPEEE